MKLGWANGLRGVVALALLTGASLARAQTAQETAVPGVEKEDPKVVAIRIVKEDGQVLSDSPSGITVETGKALDRGEIAESLRTLYRTGDYADLQAVWAPAAGGVGLEFVGRGELCLNLVRLEGAGGAPYRGSAR